jgi:hypothetical protein
VEGILMNKTIRLTLLTSIPAMLAACASDVVPYGNYTRTFYPSYASCLAAYAMIPNLLYPCVASGTGYYGPYVSTGGASWLYIGYTSSGGLYQRGISYNPTNRTYGTFTPQTRKVTRGGFGSSSRSGGRSFGG